MNQRIWQMTAMIMAGCALAGCAAASGPGASTPAGGHMPAPPDGSRTGRCGTGVLTLAYRPGLSPMTGEHGGFYELVNHGRRACTLAGYPHITLYADGDPLPFRYIVGDGPYVTSRPPATVTVQPGGGAWILVAKYRCDLGDLRAATTIAVTVPDTASALTSPVPRDGGVSALSYCRGGAGAPGQVVTVSPIEPAPDAAILS